jgi:hypothetical protein
MAKTGFLTSILLLFAASQAIGCSDSGIEPSRADARARTPAQPAPLVYRIDVQVHTAHTEMDRDKLGPVLAEAQRIWTMQAAICFEFRAVVHDDDAVTGFDVWYLPQIPNTPDVNGTIDGRRIFVRDHPVLAPAIRPAQEPAARTTAHELGHGLTLDHYEDLRDLAESLMASRKAGFALHAGEIARARGAAAAIGESMDAAYACASLR